MKAIDFGGKYLSRAVLNGEDVEAKGNMMLSATLAGIGFGSAGVHIPHSCAYPIAGLKHSYIKNKPKFIFPYLKIIKVYLYLWLVFQT